MGCRKLENMDQTIQSMLDAGPIQAVPPGFGRKVKARVTLAAMLDWERQRCRYLGGAGLAGVFAVLACVGVMAVFPQAVEWTIGRIMPGGAGYADYVISRAWYGTYTVSAVVALAVMAAAAAVVYLIQRVRSWSPMGRS